ncbi:MAG: CarD family transcriptional regulator [Pseudomonadota bacterium]
MATAKKKTTKKSAKTPAKKKTAAKTTAKKKAVKKAPAKKTATKKAAAPAAAKKKTAAKKTPAKKAAAKKAPVKKTAAKKAPAKKTAAKKAAAKTTASKKTAAKKAPAKKTATKKAAKPAAVKPAPKIKVNAGQAPRKTTLAASIPVPTQQPPKEAPQADAQASKNDKASGAAKSDFKVNDQIVYPAHGVGKIIALEKQEVAGIKIELFVIDFDQEKMKLRVPTGKAKSAGMRPLSDDKTVKNAVELLKGRARIKRTMWSRRAQEYDAKINSGDIKLVAEVVRDLFRAEDQPEQSYSERQLFEAALDRMAREVAAVRKADLGKAIEELEGALRQKKAA